MEPLINDSIVFMSNVICGLSASETGDQHWSLWSFRPRACLYLYEQTNDIAARCCPSTSIQMISSSGC